MPDANLAAIQRLLSDFAWAADRGLGTEMAELFLPNGTLTVNGQELRGRQEIADDCRQRFETPNRKTRHVWSNLRVEPVADGLCSGTVVQLTFESTGFAQPAKLRVNDVLDLFERDPQGIWQFRSRLIERQMAMALPAGL